MQKKQGQATIKALEIPDALAQYNVANNVTRARLVFSFGVNSTETDDITTQLLGRIGNNIHSVIIDITDLGLKAAQAAFVGKQALFTVFSFTIAELTSGKFTIVNNGEREYSSLSSPHVGEVDEKASFESLLARFKKDISEGRLFFGELPQDDTPPQRQGGNTTTQTPPPAQGYNTPF